MDIQEIFNKFKGSPKLSTKEKEDLETYEKKKYIEKAKKDIDDKYQ